jgi:membrane-associated phospholipid phosphatase
MPIAIAFSGLGIDRRLRVSLVLLAVFVMLSLTVHAGLWRTTDHVIAGAVGHSMMSCQIIQAGFALSPWLSAELSILYAAIAAVVVGAYQRRRAAAWLLAGLIATAPVELAAKHLIDQPPPRLHITQRPDCGPERYGMTSVVTPHVFPSGSVTRLAYFTTLAIAAVAAHVRRRLIAITIGAALLTLALAAASTRVLIGWHWPVDLLGGGLLGASMALLALWLLSSSSRTALAPATRPPAQAL